jgi:hypothetical protein
MRRRVCASQARIIDHAVVDETIEEAFTGAREGKDTGVEGAVVARSGEAGR